PMRNAVRDREHISFADAVLGAALDRDTANLLGGFLMWLHDVTTRDYGRGSLQHINDVSIGSVNLRLSRAVTPAGIDTKTRAAHECAARAADSVRSRDR